MGQPIPYEFRDEEEIVKRLSRHKTKIGKWFDKRIETLGEVTFTGVESNTFRAFRNMPKRPSLIFREWASAEFQNKKLIKELVSIDSQPRYDDRLITFSDRLCQVWRKQMGIIMPYGPSRKLPNLLLKCFVLWNGLNNKQRNNLIGYLHVPLDSFTLVGIRNCISDPQIPATATMRFVAGETMYNQIQKAIRDITSRVEVPAIYFDILAWNMSH
ncbi:MAG: hypothetical protein ACRDH2_08580 [Anaerolineales bacterium]